MWWNWVDPPPLREGLNWCKLDYLTTHPDKDRHYNHFLHHHHHPPPLNFLKALKLILSTLPVPYHSLTSHPSNPPPFLPFFALPLPYLVPLLSLSCPYLVPILSLSCPYLVPVLSLPCPCLVLNLLPLPSWNLELDPEALGLVSISLTAQKIWNIWSSIAFLGLKFYLFFLNF